MHAIRIIQITDTHLGPVTGYRLLGVDADFSLDQVLGLVDSENDHADLYLLTGDIASDGHLAAYQRMFDHMRGRGQIAWLPGNHDVPEMMTGVCEGQWLQRRVDLGSWQVLLLDSSVAGSSRGCLAQSELEALDAMLSRHSAQHTLVSLHHHVIPVGSAWLDQQVLANRDAFFELLASHDNVRLVLSGHVHQETDVLHRGIRVMTSPSTCVQFAPRLNQFGLDGSQPGYRWLDLHPDGTIQTGVSRVCGVEFHIDLAAKGY